MNNKYDRDEAPNQETEGVTQEWVGDKTYDEMVADGYQMTGEGIWIVQDDHPEVTEEFEVVESVVNLFLLKNGELILAKYSESLDGREYTFESPLLVKTENVGNQSNVSYENWMPLSKERSITVSSDFVASVTEPIREVVTAYREINNG